MMGTKNQPGEFDCYGNADSDEPMFILLARDALAPRLVEHWALGRNNLIARGLKPITDRKMVDEAFACADAMRKWRLTRDQGLSADHLRQAGRDTCGACRFYRKDTCRRSPPIRLPRKFDPDASAGNRVRDEQLIFGWPTVNADDWCGDFEAGR